MSPKNILIACERSGKVRDAFIRSGHNAVSCDLEPSESSFGPHIQGDVTKYLGEKWKWDLIIAHPDCTYLCNSGVRWLFTEPGRFIKMSKAAKFFVKCLNANAPQISVENPIPHGYAMVIIKKRYSQIIQPWQFGHGETKATCLWLVNLPLLKPSNIVAGRLARIYKMSPSPERGWLRSVTYDGIAEAMADQWGNL
jgi:hypothetical protein